MLCKCSAEKSKSRRFGYCYFGLIIEETLIIQNWSFFLFSAQVKLNLLLDVYKAL